MRHTKSVVVLILVAGALRFGFWLLTHNDAPFGDEDCQLAHARDMVLTGNQHVFWPPMSIWLSAGLIRLWDTADHQIIRFVWFMLDVCNCVLVYAVCLRLFDRKVGFWAAFLYAIYPAAIARAVFMTSEVPTILFLHLGILVLFLSWQKSHLAYGLLAGMFFALSSLSRGTSITLLFLFPAASLLIPAAGKSGARRLAVGAVMLIGGLALWLPWVTHNRLVGGQWIVISTNASANLAQSTDPKRSHAHGDLFIIHPRATREQIELRKRVLSASGVPAEADAGEPGRTNVVPLRDQTPAQQFALNRIHRKEAARSIRAAPGSYAVSCIGRFARVWALDTHVKSLFGQEQWGAGFGPPVLLLMAWSNLIFVFAALAGVVGLVMTKGRIVQFIGVIYVLGPLIPCALVIGKPRYHLSAIPLLLGFGVWAFLNRRIWWPEVSRRVLTIVGACWAFLGWTWIAWIIFCYTSRFPV